MPQQFWVFGFGSLINSRSRARTLGAGLAVPVRVSGLRRGWYAQGAEFRHTALGVVADAAATCNGVLAHLPADRVAALDARESQYERVELAACQIQALSGPVPEGTIVTYMPPAPKTPDAAHPIIRSYLDVTLSGCLEYGPEFAHEMLDTTHAWSEHLEDDREDPRYHLSEAHAPRSLLDTLLSLASARGLTFRATPAT